MDNKSYHIPTVTLIREGDVENGFLSLEGTIELISWKDFERKFGRYGSYKRSENHKRITLYIGGDEVVDNPVITQEHVAAYEYIIEHQEEIKKSILTALYTEYQNLQEQYDYDEEEAKELMPVIKKMNHFRI